MAMSNGVPAIGLLVVVVSLGLTPVWIWLAPTIVATLTVKKERRHLAKLATPFLLPDEVIQAVFKARGTSGRLYSKYQSVKYRKVDWQMIVVTNLAILILNPVFGFARAPRDMPTRYSRNFFFGPQSGIIYGKFEFANRTYVVPRRYFPEISAADAALARMARGA
jgi:hypothetical protein